MPECKVFTCKFVDVVDKGMDPVRHIFVPWHIFARSRGIQVGWNGIHVRICSRTFGIQAVRSWELMLNGLNLIDLPRH